MHLPPSSGWAKFSIMMEYTRKWSLLVYSVFYVAGTLSTDLRTNRHGKKQLQIAWACQPRQTVVPCDHKTSKQTRLYIKAFRKI